MKTTLTALLLFIATVVSRGNTAPTPVVISAAMRPSTTLMDVVYRVNDPDDATVKVRALAFVDGVRSFAKVLRPVTFVEGTVTNLGDAITANAEHTLTWDVGADWNIDLGQVKFEILCRDGRGLLSFDWITIPAAGGKPALTISKDSPSDASVLNALFWQYAVGDSALTLGNGRLSGNATSSVFAGFVLADGSALQVYSSPYIFKLMNLDPANNGEVNHAAVAARAGLVATTKWHAANRPYAGISIIFSWGANSYGQTTLPYGISGPIAISAGEHHSLALMSGGVVVAWGRNHIGQSAVPAGLTDVTAIAAGSANSLALKSDGTVVAWGWNNEGQATVPAGLTGVTAITAGYAHNLALKNDGNVVGWGWNANGQTTVPAGLTGVTAIAAGNTYSLALKSDGTVIAWGETTVPAGLTAVTAIAAGYQHSLALKSDGTVVAWGNNGSGQTTVPIGLTGVTAIAAGGAYSLALKGGGTVVAWGNNDSGQTTIPAGLTGVSAIAAGYHHSLAVKRETP